MPTRWAASAGGPAAAICPDLTIYPAIRRDATADNFRVKQETYAGSRLYFSAHSAWLLDRARQSMLGAGAVDYRLLPTGVDLSTFRPGDQRAARAELGLPGEQPILLFAANRARTSGFKDSATALETVRRMARAAPDNPYLLVALGEDGPAEAIDSSELRWLPYERDLHRLAMYYQAADVFLHAANADNFPTTILQALACGLPVVATAVGGIPEQVRSLAGAPGAWDGAGHPRGEATGVLVPPRDPAAMAEAATALMTDPALRNELARNAAADAHARFDPDRQLDATIEWYRDVVADWAANSRLRAAG